MGFLKSLFKSDFSDKPEDYNKIYFRWEDGGREYGPHFFDDMITRNWSGPPIEGRFENENKWRKYDYFLEILNNLKASQNQLSMLHEYNVSVDKASLKFRDAIKIIKNKEEEIRKQRAVERQEKKKLPATKNTINKLKSYSINYSDNITRAEAKALISEYEEKEQVKQILSDFKKRGTDISSKFDIEASLKESANKFSFVELLSDLNDLFTRLSKFEVTYLLPDKLNAELVLEINNKIENALFDAEDAEEQIKDREFSTFDADYKIIGKLHKSNFQRFNKEVIESHLLGNWDFERNIFELLKRHFPEIKLKKDEF